MLKSMTGFGRSVKTLPDKTVTVEIKSLNSKYFDLNLRLPSVYKEKEIALRKEMADLLELGKIDLVIAIDRGEAGTGFSINKELAKTYLKELNDLCDELKISKDDLLSKIMRMPDVIAVEQEPGFSEEEWKSIHATIQEAIKALDDFRKTEGEGLEKDLLKRIVRIEKSLQEIKKLEPKRMSGIKSRIAHNLSEYIGKEKIDNNRFEQELIYYLEKFDITEETVRLKSHCDYFTSTSGENNSSKGKKLAFIAQEIGREINTIGSKANDAAMQKLVVEMKDELEKIKEQLNNVL